MDAMKFALCFLFFISIYAAEPINLASVTNGATCTASSSLSPDTICTKALDSLETSVTHQWVSEREGAGAVLNIEFASGSNVQELRFLQGCNAADLVKEVRVDFSNGESKLIGLSCTGGNDAEDCDMIQWENYPLGVPIYSKTAAISVTQTCELGGFVGFREVSVIGSIPDPAQNVALLQVGGTCQSSSFHETNNATCDHAIDGNVTAVQYYVFRTSGGDTTGAWLNLSFASLTDVEQIRVKNRCTLNNQMKIIAVEFEGGIAYNMSLNCFDGEDYHNCPNQIWNEMDIPNLRTRYITITGLEGCPGETIMSFQQVEVYGVLENTLPCPFGYDYVQNLDSCYRFITIDTPLDAARAECPDNHPLAHLVRIDSDLEQDYLRRHSQQLQVEGATCTNYITDGYRTAPDANDWFWESTGNQIYFTNFAAGPWNGFVRITLSQQHLWAWLAIVDNSEGRYCYICEI